MTKKCGECGFEFQGEVCDVCYDSPDQEDDRNDSDPEQHGHWEEDEYGRQRWVWK